MAERPDIRALVPRASAARLSRRAFLSGLVVIGGTSVLAACAKSTGFAPSALPDGRVEGKLNVYSWGDYDDPANIRSFQKTGTSVQFDSFGSNEELIAKLGATRGTSGYDIIVPTGSYIPMMAKNGLLEPLDHRYLKNMGNIDPLYLDQSWDPGNKYTVCKDWGTTGFVYDTRAIKRDLLTWGDFLDAATTEASKNVALLEDPWEVACTFFAANGIDPNTTKKADLEAANEYLVNTLAPHVKAFNSVAVTSGIPEETFTLMQAFNGDVRQGLLATDKPDAWKFVYPTPTANLWMDNWAIARGAQNMDAAYQFIDYILEPEVSFREVDYIGYSTGIKDLAAMAKKHDFSYPELVFPDAEVIQRLTPAEVNSSAGELVAILNRMMAKAGS